MYCGGCAGGGGGAARARAGAGGTVRGWLRAGSRAAWGVALTTRGGGALEHRLGPASGTLGFERRLATRTRVLLSRDGTPTWRAWPPPTAAHAERAGGAQRGRRDRARGVIAARRGREALGIGFDARADERYLGFGERSNAVDQRGNVVENYVADGPYQPDGAPGDRRASCPPLGLPPARRRHLLPDPVAALDRRLRRAGRQHRDAATSASAASRRRMERRSASAPTARRARSAARALRCVLRRARRRADVLRRFTARHRPPAARRPRPGSSARGSSRRAPTTQLEQIEHAARGATRPSRSRRPTPHYLPVRRPARAARGRARADGRCSTTPGVAITTYFNPMICTELPAGLRRGGGARRADQERARPALRVPLQHRSTSLRRRPVRLLRAAGAARSTSSCCAEAVDDGHDGWMEDFGEYTPLDSRSANGMAGVEMHNLYPHSYHCTAVRLRRAQRRPLAPLPPLGLHRRRAAARRWSGAATRRPTGASTASRSAVKQRRSRWASPASAPGAPTSAASSRSARAQLTPRAAHALGPVRRRVRRDAHPGATASRSPTKARPQVEDDEKMRQLAALREAAHAALSVPGRGRRARTAAPGCRSCATWALAYPGDPRAARREDEYLFGPRPAGRAGARARARRSATLLPAARRAGSTSGARLRYRGGGGGLALAGRARRLKGGRRASRCRRRSTELPLFVRAGAVLPLLPADVDTLAGYGRRARDGEAAPTLRPAHAARLPARHQRGGALPARAAALERAARAMEPEDPRSAQAPLHRAGVAGHAAPAVQALSSDGWRPPAAPPPGPIAAARACCACASVRGPRRWWPRGAAGGGVTPTRSWSARASRGWWPPPSWPTPASA